MKVLFLTTVTPHHNFFINSLRKTFPEFEFAIINEQPINFSTWKVGKKKLKQLIEEKKWWDIIRFFPYYKLNPFAKLEKRYEREAFPLQHAPEVETHNVENVNKTAELVRTIKPDLIIVFGARKLSADFLATLQVPCINIHHAVLPHIRGLDSAIWLAALGEYEYIGSSIHYVTPGLDEGQILKRARLDIPPGTHLWQVRKINTELTLSLMVELLKNWEYNKQIVEENPLTIGKYYSFPLLSVYLRAAINLWRRKR